MNAPFDLAFFSAGPSSSMTSRSVIFLLRSLSESSNALSSCASCFCSILIISRSFHRSWPTHAPPFSSPSSSVLSSSGSGSGIPASSPSAAAMLPSAPRASCSVCRTDAATMARLSTLRRARYSDFLAAWPPPPACVGGAAGAPAPPVRRERGTKMGRTEGPAATSDSEDDSVSLPLLLLLLLSLSLLSLSLSPLPAGAVG
mmetsp:Transcript_11221/g.22181  ORF Transcript_11221/g.22181 Transcript_11221/m.22181 type:complete len:201 (+) Transcript_11221:508-1110(+)